MSEGQFALLVGAHVRWFLSGRKLRSGDFMKEDDLTIAYNLISFLGAFFMVCFLFYLFIILKKQL